MKNIDKSLQNGVIDLKKGIDSMDHSVLHQKPESFMELDLRHWPGFFFYILLVENRKL